MIGGTSLHDGLPNSTYPTKASLLFHHLQYSPFIGYTTAVLQWILVFPRVRRTTRNSVFSLPVKSIVETNVNWNAQACSTAFGLPTNPIFDRSKSKQPCGRTFFLANLVCELPLIHHNGIQRVDLSPIALLFLTGYVHFALQSRSQKGFRQNSLGGRQKHDSPHQKFACGCSS